MKYKEDSLIQPSLEALQERIPKKYELVLTATRRAKQIIRDMRLNTVGYSEDDLRRKPLSIALNDIVEGRVDSTTLSTPDINFTDYEEGTSDLFTDIDSLGPPEEGEAGDDFPEASFPSIPDDADQEEEEPDYIDDDEFGLSIGEEDD
ncbi:MAG: DNA-directed RNA polymerase subunit omega [Planctomycetales bacterium]|nr:DNA-directed RNA polymerase subunit omega [bacterium]UNM09824.1 MAG: DNA-directed RNA polymerase subunit omega [Planctomycetales bacterium]